MVVGKCMAVIRIAGPSRNIHGVALGLGPGPKGPPPMVVGKYMVVIRSTGSL